MAYTLIIRDLMKIQIHSHIGHYNVNDEQY